MRLAHVSLLLASLFGVAMVRAEEADPRKPAAITTENVPPVSEELMARLAQYQSVRNGDFEGWAPDGRGMLIGTRFGNSTQLHRVFEPGGRRDQITFFEEPVSGRFVPQAKDGAVLYTMSRGGDENFQINLLLPKEYRYQRLTDGKSRNELGPVRDDGSQFIFHSNRRNGRDTDLYVADTRKPDSAEMLFETDGQFWVASDWSRDGARLALAQYVSINESHPALFDVAARQLQKLPPAGDGKVAYADLKFAPDGASVYLASDARGEFLELARYHVADQRYEWLAEDLKWDVSAIEVDKSGRVAFTINEDGASKLFVLEGNHRRAIDLPLGIVGSLDFSPDGEHLGFTLARPDAPADAYSVKLADGSLTRWTFSEAGGLDPARFIAPTRIAFSSFDGRMIPAYYFKPAGASREKPVPVLISIHGGPEAQYQPFFNGTTQFFLNELGMAVICPNVRGSAGYGKTYLLLDNAEKREDSVRDIGALLDWIKTQPELDASRVAVMGGSYGGYMVLASLTHFPDRIKAGVDIVGIASFISFLERTSPYRQDLRRAEYGDERDPAMRAHFQKIDPLANAEKIASALLVVHGKNDPRVPFFEAQQIADKVKAAGRTVWTVYADNEGHGFAKKDNRDYMTAVQALFLQEQLK